MPSNNQVLQRTAAPPVRQIRHVKNNTIEISVDFFWDEIRPVWEKYMFGINTVQTVPVQIFLIIDGDKIFARPFFKFFWKIFIPWTIIDDDERQLQLMFLTSINDSAASQPAEAPRHLARCSIALIERV